MKTRLLLCISIAIIFAIHSNGQTPKFNVLATYTIPGKASGLAFDGTYLYSGIYGSGGDAVYRIDTSNGSSMFLCSGPMGDAYGLTYDGQYFWTTDHDITSTPAQAIQFDHTGAKLDTFDLVTTYMSGIAYDNGDFWVAAYYNPDGEIYKVDNSGNILSQFPSPFLQPWDLCLQNQFLWIVDYYNNTIDKVDTTGNLIDSQPSLGDRPAGIVFDGKYLWYVAGPLNDSSILYKVGIDIIQEPQIYFPVVYHDFGDILVGGSGVWDAIVKNIGLADLQIDSVGFSMASSPISSTTIFPITILPGDSATIEFMFKPVTSGVIYDTALVYSNSSFPAPELEFRGNGTTVGFKDVDIVKNVAVYPNPFSRNTIITFNMLEPKHVSVRIYNIVGEMVGELKNELMGSGSHKVSWDAGDKNGVRLPAGTYFCVIQGGNFKVVEKVVILD